MKSFAPLVCLAALAALPPAAVGASPAVAPARWKIERHADGVGPLPVASDALQQIAQQVGTGHFVVSDCRCEFPESSRAAQILFLHASETARRSGGKPLGRALVIDGRCAWFDDDDDAGLLTAAMLTLGLDRGTEVQLRPAVPELVAAVFSGGTARVVTPADGFHCHARDWTWQGELIAGSRHEHLAVRWTAGATPHVEIQRAATPFPASVVADAPAILVQLEQWTVAEAPAWRPTKRYQVRLALAALRHDPVRDYRLAVDLLADSDPGAQAAGLRLLKQTAATGYPDACHLLAHLETSPPHPGDDRERDRPER